MPELKNVRVSPEIHKQLRLTAIHNSMLLQEAVEMIIKAYYDSRNKD